MIEYLFPKNRIGDSEMQEYFKFTFTAGSSQSIVLSLMQELPERQ